jgi:hypothetical protein
MTPFVIFAYPVLQITAIIYSRGMIRWRAIVKSCG